jgi:hypothetical protein
VWTLYNLADASARLLDFSPGTHWNRSDKMSAFQVAEALTSADAFRSIGPGDVADFSRREARRELAVLDLRRRCARSCVPVTRRVLGAMFAIWASKFFSESSLEMLCLPKLQVTHATASHHAAHLLRPRV